MDITQLMPNLARNADIDEESVDVAEGPKGVKTHGPQKFRYITAGQQRRQVVRDELTKRRKASLRHRRAWMQNRRAIAALRGQLQVVGVVPFSDPDLVVSQDSALHRTVVRHLEKVYGSVEAAAEHYRTLLNEQRRAA